MVGVELDQGSNGWMIEAFIGIVDHALKFGWRDGALGEGRNHSMGYFGIRRAAQGIHRRVGQAWPAFRHVQSAVARQARQQDIFESEYGRLPPCRYVAQEITFPTRNATHPNASYGLVETVRAHATSEPSNCNVRDHRLKARAFRVGNRIRERFAARYFLCAAVLGA